MAHVYIIHGYHASPDDHWFPWLEKMFLKDGLSVTRIHLPHPHEPNLQNWLKTLQQEAILDKDSYIVAHSLGCIAAAHYISQADTQIAGAIFVSGFDRKVPNLEALDQFVETIPNMAQVGRLVTQKLVVMSHDDTIVPPELTRQFAADIDAPLKEFDTAGHFLASDGFTELPVVYDTIRAMIAR
jgi:predicted alpha/beta hydrolase family esterase